VKQLFAIAGALALVATTVVLQDSALARRSRFAADEDVLYLPRPSVLRPLSLGHHELTADLVFIRAVIYFGGELGHKREYKWLDRYLDTIVALDPRWRTPYRWAGVATMYDGRPITNERVQLSNHFLELGVAQFPRDWELPFMLGCNYLFELKSDDAAEQASWQRQGGEWMRHAAIVGGAPSWVPLLAATILHKEGQDEAAIRHLEEVYVTTQDPKTRQEVKNRLVSLHAQLDFAREAHEREQLEAGWRRTIPYGPIDLYVLIGPRHSPRLDVGELMRDRVLDLDLAEPAKN
jgi:hypothetical protein